MEKFLKNQQIPLTQVIDPNTGQAYYAPQNVVYDDKVDSGPTYLRDVIVDQAISSSYFSGSITNAISASYALTASYIVGFSASSVSSSHALTASYAFYAVSASYAANGGVTQLLAGPNITLSPTNGLGQVTVSATLSGSTIFNTATGSYGSFYDTTTQTNPIANIARSMSFNSTDISNGVSISGSTSPFNTYIKTQNAGVYNIQFSAQLDKTDSGTDDVVIWLRKNGVDLTDTATTLTLTNNNTKLVAAWNWFVTSATGDYYQIIWRSLDTDLRLLAEPISGTHPGIPSVILTVSRVDQFLSNTGSFSGSFTGTFTGSFSGSGNITSASYAVQAGNSNTIDVNSFGSPVESYLLMSNVVATTGVAIGGDADLRYNSSTNVLTVPNISATTLTASNATISGNVTVLGTASINTLIVNQIGYSSGSNQLGDAANDTQTLYGSVIIPTGSLTVTGSTRITGSLNVTGQAVVTNGAYVYNNLTIETSNLPVLNLYDSLQTHTWQFRSNGTSLSFLDNGTTRMWIGGIGSGNGGKVGINTINTSAQLTVKGSGTTSATTALLVQNANASASLQVYDDGTTVIGSNTWDSVFYSLWSPFKTRINGGNLSIFSSGGTSTSGPSYELNFYARYFNPGQGYQTGKAGYIVGNAVGISNDNGSGRGTLTLGTVYSNYTTPGERLDPVPTIYMTNTAVNGAITGSGRVGINQSSPSYTLDVNGTTNITGSLLVTGSINVTGGITGSITSASFASTASFVNPLRQTVSLTGSLSITGSAGTGSALYAYKSGSTVLDIQGSQGQLFSVTDALSGSLMSVNDVSGLPILEVFSDDRVVMGTYGAPGLTVSGSTIRATGSLLGTASFATSASWAPSSPAFPYNGNAVISGSLTVTGSLIVSGSSTLVNIGPAEFTGSFKIKNGATPVMDTTLGYLYDTYGNASVSFSGNQLLNYYGINTVNWGSYYLIGSSGNISVDWDNRILNDSTGAARLRWNSTGVQVTGSLNITGSLTVGNITSTPSTENSLNVYPPSAGGTGEGGQMLLAASGGLYTSASMLDNWQNQFRILRGSNTGGSDAGLVYVDLQSGNTQFIGAVTASAYSGLPNDYLYVTRRSPNQTIPSGTWANQDIIFNNTVVSKGITYNVSTGLADLVGGKVYRITSRLAWSAAATYLLQYSCYDNSNNQIGPTVEIIQSTNGTNNISDGTLDFIYAPVSNIKIKIRTTNNTTALTGEEIRSDLNTQLIIQQIA